MEEVNAEKDAKVVEKNADVQGRPEESQAKVYHIDLEYVDKVLKVVTAATTIITAATITTATTTITAATIIAAPTAARRRKGIVIRDPKETATPSTMVHTEPKSKDKGKRIMVEEPKPLKKQAQIEQDEAYARELKAKLNRNINWDDVIEQVKEKGKQVNAVMGYQALKRKPQTEAQARNIMMVYLKNMAGFKMDYFKGISYDDIRPIFEKYFNSNMAFLKKSKEKLEEEESRALKRTSEKVVTTTSATITAATTSITAVTLIAAPSAARRRKGVVIRDPKETATPSTIIHSETKSKDKGKGIMVEEPKPLKKQAQIEQDEAYARKLEAELNKTIHWDEVIEQVQRKEKEDNVVMRNMAGFKMDDFKGMSYDDIRPIFEKY
nr:hypothetical protein [Tanacetum cinerariifolium]